MDSIVQSLRGQLPSPWLEVLLILAAVVCGAIIGTDRQKHQKSAGLRTLMLVCMGSAMFTMTSFVFSSSTGDSGRVAAQIVTGIGFLGAGAILHSRGGVTGMTTAATIWVAAAVGMTIGTGYPVAGLGACLLIRVVLAGIREWEIQHLGGMRTATIEIVFNPDFGKTRVRLERLRSEARVAAPIEEQESLEGGLVRARIGLRLTNNSYCEFLGSVVDLPQVKEIREVS